MGALFDGQNGTVNGSAAHIASLLQIPIVLIVDVYGMTRSVNALLQGFLDFDPEVKVVGIIFNRAGSQKHYEMIFDSLIPRFRALSLGFMPRYSTENIPERHLGLLTIEENDRMKETLEIYLETAEKTLSLQPLFEKIELKYSKNTTVINSLPQPLTSHKIRLGIAKDKAFCFYYKQNLNLLEEAGAKLVFFSPVEDSILPEDLDGLYFGGGYPEIFAQQLEDNISIRFQILRYAQEGMPIYAECGGLIYLCKKLLCEDDQEFLMAGIFPYTIKWNKDYLAIRYVDVKTTQDTLLGPKNLIIKGQEFHQTRFLDLPEEFVGCYKVTSSTNEEFSEGCQIKNTLGSYMHLYFPSQPKISHHFISKCENYHKEKYVSQST